VKASAQIITITELSEGDVYQRLDGSSDLRYGLVTQVLNNGEDAVIQALEVKSDYFGPKPEVKTFGTDADVKIFPADPLLVKIHLDEVHAANEKKLADAKKALVDAEKVHAQVIDILARYSNSEMNAALVEYGN
jgi:hypothetical protein